MGVFHFLLNDCVCSHVHLCMHACACVCVCACVCACACVCVCVRAHTLLGVGWCRLLNRLPLSELDFGNFLFYAAIILQLWCFSLLLFFIPLFFLILFND